MSTVSFEGRPKEAVAAERAADPNYVPPQDRINVEVGRFAYRPSHQRQVVYKYTSYKEDTQNFDDYVDKCIQDAILKGKINFVYNTPGHTVFIGVDLQ